MKKSCPTVNFVLVGKIDRQNPNSIKSNVLDSWVSSGVVEHWGDIPYEKMPDVYRKATIVCLLSYREGMPKALLEGASSGRPIIAFDVVGCREIVKDGVNGRLIQFQDTQSLEDALLDLISCPKKCQRFGNMGRYQVVNQFSSKIINEKVFEVWEDLLGDIKGG